MVMQGRLLMTMIETAVANVRDPGRRHASYGLKAADYETVDGALLPDAGAGPRH
jgi:hypothetical protein